MVAARAAAARARMAAAIRARVFMADLRGGLYHRRASARLDEPPPRALGEEALDGLGGHAVALVAEVEAAEQVEALGRRGASARASRRRGEARA